jgi:hypothetical protein
MMIMVMPDPTRLFMLVRTPVSRAWQMNILVINRFYSTYNLQESTNRTLTAAIEFFV